MSKMGKLVSVLKFIIVKIMLPVCLIGSGYFGWQYYKSKEIKMKRKPPKKQVVMVETVLMEPGTYQTSVEVMGKVMADRQVGLKSKVGGEVVFVAPGFVEGGVMKKGELLIKLDDSDFRIEVKKSRSSLDKSLSGLAIEKGSQSIAKEEFKLLNKFSKQIIQPTDLALRKPQLIQAKAAVQSARADLEKAELNLSRTRIRLPFNALVLEKDVSRGSLLAAQGKIATLVNIDAYRVEALVPPDRLSVIHTGNESGSRAIIQSQYDDQSWEGRIIRTTGKISEKSRMAGVIILIQDPLGLKKNPNKPRPLLQLAGETGIPSPDPEGVKETSQLLLGDHVDVRIMGETLRNVYAIPRSVLRDGNTVWVYNSGSLDIKTVVPAWKEDAVIYIKSGIQPGDRVITSDLPAPVKGMALQIASKEKGRP